MCGLFAIINTDKTLADKDILSKALKSLAHRGPDFSNTWTKEHIALGHQRLSIFDVSEKAHQPLVYRSLRIIYNGAIYNYIELRSQLQAIGFDFNSNSDTEVICAAYLAWGPSFLDRLNGMWSFVIFDERDDTVFISRDRFGIKPLYYLCVENTFYFGSEQKAFLQIPGYETKLNYNSAKLFLQSGQTCFKKDTFFEGINNFPAGSYGVLRDGKLKVSKFYDLKNKLVQPPKELTYGSAKEQFRRLLEDSLRIRLRSDVAIGFSQSGGIDSSSLVGLANSFQKSEPIHSFSVCFDAYSQEEQMIDLANAAYGSVNQKSRPNANGLVSQLRALTLQQDQPVASASVLAQNHLYRLVHKSGYKVIIGGQGADEICFGYDAFIKYKLRKNPLRFFESPLFYSQLIYKYLTKDPSTFSLLHGIKQPTIKHSTELDFAIHMINQSVLPALLHFEDRNSMQYGVESRLPFLDYRLVEFCLSCPPSFFNKGADRKRLLKESMRNIVPDAILNRKDKNAFASSQSHWMKKNTNALSEILQKHYPLLESFSRYEDIKKLPADSIALWRVLNLILFRETFDI